MLGSSHAVGAVGSCELSVNSDGPQLQGLCQYRMSEPGEGHSFESPQRRERAKECSCAIGNVKVRFQYAEPIASARQNPETTVWKEVTSHSELPKRHAAVLAGAYYKAILMQIKSN